MREVINHSTHIHLLNTIKSTLTQTLNSAVLYKLVVRISVLSPILILEVLQLCPKILALTLCSFQSSDWMQLKYIIGLHYIFHSILKDPNPLEQFLP